jgi:hypothetical protein
MGTCPLFWNKAVARLHCSVYHAWAFQSLTQIHAFCWVGYNTTTPQNYSKIPYETSNTTKPPKCNSVDFPLCFHIFPFVGNPTINLPFGLGLNLTHKTSADGLQHWLYHITFRLIVFIMTWMHILHTKEILYYTILYNYIMLWTVLYDKHMNIEISHNICIVMNVPFISHQIMIIKHDNFRIRISFIIVLFSP